MPDSHKSIDPSLSRTSRHHGELREPKGAGLVGEPGISTGNCDVETVTPGQCARPFCSLRVPHRVGSEHVCVNGTLPA